MIFFLRLHDNLTLFNVKKVFEKTNQSMCFQKNNTKTVQTKVSLPKFYIYVYNKRFY
jgi:hypothetical protein